MSSFCHSPAWIAVQPIRISNIAHTSYIPRSNKSIRTFSSPPRRPRYIPKLCQAHQNQKTQSSSSSPSSLSDASTNSSPPPPSPPDSPFVPGVSAQLPFYLLLVAAQAVPFIFPSSGVAGDLTYFSTTAIAAIVIGCRRAIFEPPELSAPISRTQAIVAPFAASTFLFGAYLLLKYTDINIALAFNGITTFAGALCVKEAMDPVFQSLLSLIGLDSTILWRPEEVSDNSPPTITLTSVCSTLTSLAITAAYLNHVAPVFVFSNIIAIGICTRVLSLIRPTSFTVAAGLLCGLFFYDIFWVFGSEVMVSVATQIDSPGKLLFPRSAADIASGQYAYPYAILGLGDLCVPGFFISVAQEMDRRLVNGISGKDKEENKNVGWGEKKPYFTTAMVAYSVGLLTCFGANLQTHAAQPALLYLVPSLIFSALAMGTARGELMDVLGFKSDMAKKTK